MFAIERHRAIIKLLNEKGNVTISELVNIFGVSSETIRKDLLSLEKNNALTRTHGGAVSIEKINAPASLKVRKNKCVPEKTELCQYAMRFIKNGDVIAIDEGSTAVELAKLIACTLSKLTVLTNSIEIFNILSSNSGIELILCGGDYVQEELAFTGYLAVNTISQVHTQKAFIFPSAVSLKHGLTVYFKNFISIQKAYIENTDNVFILADSEKFETAAFLKLEALNPEYTYITDSGLSNEIYEEYKKNKINIIKG